MSAKKSLNEHLFDQLDRLSNADADNIDLETTKAFYIIQVSEKILDAARLKLQIIETNEALLNTFTEIDNPNSVLIENKKPELLDDNYPDIQDDIDMFKPSVNGNDNHVKEPQFVNEDTDLLLQRAAWNNDKNEDLEEDANGNYLTEEKKSQQNQIKKKNQNRL